MSAQLPDFTRIAAGIEAMSVAVKRATEQMREMATSASWHLRIQFADTKKERRRLQREHARATRRPALIHKGGKP